MSDLIYVREQDNKTIMPCQSFSHYSSDNVDMISLPLYGVRSVLTEGETRTRNNTHSDPMLINELRDFFSVLYRTQLNCLPKQLNDMQIEFAGVLNFHL